MDESEAIDAVKRIFLQVPREVIDEEADRYWDEIQGRE